MTFLGPPRWRNLGGLLGFVGRWSSGCPCWCARWFLIGCQGPFWWIRQNFISSYEVFVKAFFPAYPSTEFWSILCNLCRSICFLSTIQFWTLFALFYPSFLASGFSTGTFVCAQLLFGFFLWILGYGHTWCLIFCFSPDVLSLFYWAY